MKIASDSEKKSSISSKVIKLELRAPSQVKIKHEVNEGDIKLQFNNLGSSFDDPKEGET
jgi:hypothetical protein